jgi:hypothetical protein
MQPSCDLAAAQHTVGGSRPQGQCLTCTTHDSTQTHAVDWRPAHTMWCPAPVHLGAAALVHRVIMHACRASHPAQRHIATLHKAILQLQLVPLKLKVPYESPSRAAPRMAHSKPAGPKAIFPPGASKKTHAPSALHASHACLCHYDTILHTMCRAVTSIHT